MTDHEAAQYERDGDSGINAMEARHIARQGMENGVSWAWRNPYCKTYDQTRKRPRSVDAQIVYEHMLWLGGRKF